MKKSIKIAGVFLALLLWCAAPRTMQAQVGEFRSNLAVGVNGGLNFSSVGFTPTIKQGMLSGINSGVTLLYTCEKYFKTIAALQMEINYAQRGWVEDINAEEYCDNTYERSVTYIEVPLMAHLGWGKEERGLQFFVNAGPQFSFYLSDKETYGGNDEWNPDLRPSGTNAQYGKEIENSFDYGIAGGLGLDLNTSIGHFMLEGRYYYGFGNLFSDSKKDPFSCSNNSVITVKLSYLVDLFRRK
jgi:hypothetical protein